MKNQYFGDLNDYRKYGLLRLIQAKASLRLLVCWMLTPDDETNQGRDVSWLEQPAKWRRFDPELFHKLEGLVATFEKDVRNLEAAELIPDARYHLDLLTDDRDQRAAWFERVLDAATTADLVFLDPDNGFETPSLPMGRKASSRYLYWTEVGALWRRGVSLLVYQHFPRKPRDEFLAELTGELGRRTGASLVEAIWSPHVAFLLAGQEAHREGLAAALGALDGVWKGQLERQQGSVGTSSTGA